MFAGTAASKRLAVGDAEYVNADIYNKVEVLLIKCINLIKFGRLFAY
jgi:hypothetical protein